MNFHFFFMGSAGDFFPLFRTSIELLSRGHSITFVACDEYVWIKPFVDAAGIGFIAMNSDSRYENGEKPTFEVGGHRSLSDLVIPTLDVHWKYVHDTYVPGKTVYVNYIGYAGVKLACEHLGAPYVGVIYSANPLDETGIFDAISIQKITDSANQLLLGYGINKFVSVDLAWLMSSRYNLAYFPEWMDTDIKETYFYAGFPLPDNNNVELPSQVREFLMEKQNEKIVLFTPGTSMPNPVHYADIVIRACAELDVNCIIVSFQSSGINVAPAVQSRVLLLNQIEFEALFDKVDVVVHHAGIGTLSEALRAGTPQLVKPECWDQFYNSDFIKSLNVGVAIAKDAFTVDEVRRQLAELLSSAEIQHACDEISVRCAAQDGIVRSADFLERL